MRFSSFIISILLAASWPIAPERPPKPHMVVLETEQREGYTCRLVEYSSSGKERLRTFLLVPDGASRKDKKPALVLLHDHGARFDIGKEKLARPMASAPEYIKKSSRQWVSANFDGIYLADSLAALGYVVIVPEQLYWGGRASSKCGEWSERMFGGETLSKAGVKALKPLRNEVYEGQRAVYDSLASKGICWAEKTLAEDIAAVEVLRSLPFVDKRRIGAFGWSMGAHRCFLLTAFCKHVRTGVSLSWMTLKELEKEPYSASVYSMLIPSLRNEYDFPDIARWLAPKPYMFLSGTEDHLFPKEAVEECYSRMQAYYAEKAAGRALETVFFEGGHHCGREEQRLIVSYLDSALRQRSSRHTSGPIPGNNP